MTTRAVFLSVTPMIPAGPSLSEALGFFTEHLGFATSWQTESMAAIGRDGIEFHLVRNDLRAWAENASFSFGVSDLETLYAEYAGSPATVGPLETKPWGRREFHMILPSGVCFQFYEQGAPPR
jgi:hypothetical protein